MEMKRAGTLKVSKKTSAAFSLFLLGLRGASVSSTGCYRDKNLHRRRLLTFRDEICVSLITQHDERRSPPQRKSAVALWNKHTARSSPCHSSPSLSHVPSDTAPTTSPCAPDRHRVGKIEIRDIRKVGLSSEDNMFASSTVLPSAQGTIISHSQLQGGDSACKKLKHPLPGRVAKRVTVHLT